MNINKAIEILELQIRLTSPNLEPDLISANKLGIEALKAWKERREKYPMLNTYLLPGETED